jgi:coenzyme Q-binding protein COQ10
MPSFSTRRFTPFTPGEMYAVVADVERYPEFLPLCESLVVTSRKEQANQTVLVATMGVGYKAIRESFTTRATLSPRTPAILVEYIDGPFHHLENRWRFLPAGGGSEIDFFIDYEFRSRMLALLMGSLFDQAFRRFAEAFDERARKVYGDRRLG